MAIKSVSSIVTKETLSITKLPSALSKLERLESLVLSGHNIASDGISARIFDGRTLPKLDKA